MQTDNLKSDHSKVFSVLHADSDLLMRKNKLALRSLLRVSLYLLDEVAVGAECGWQPGLGIKAYSTRQCDTRPCLTKRRP